MRKYINSLITALMLVGFIVGVAFYSPPHSETMRNVCVFGVIASFIMVLVSLWFELVKMSLIFCGLTIVYSVWLGEYDPTVIDCYSHKVIDLPEEIEQAQEGESLTVLKVTKDTIYIGFEY